MADDVPQDGEDPTTASLRVDQIQREREADRRAQDAPTDSGTERHAREAERAAYLGEKLEERAESERRAARED